MSETTRFAGLNDFAAVNGLFVDLNFRGDLDLNPAADLYNSAAAKLHLAGVLLERAWNATSH